MKHLCRKKINWRVAYVKCCHCRFPLALVNDKDNQWYTCPQCGKESAIRRARGRRSS